MHGKSRPRATATTATIAVTASTPMSMRERYAYVLKQNIGNSSTRLLRSSRLDKAMMLFGGESPRRNSSKGGDDSMNASTLKVSGDRDLRIGRIYLTGMIAAVPVAVAAIFAASPTAAPAQLSLDAAGQSAVLLKVAPPPAPCRWPGGGDSPRSVCPGSNQKDTTRTGSNGSNGGPSGRSADTSMEKPDTSMGRPDTSTEGDMKGGTEGDMRG
jgi:hypothetical protein